MQTGEEQVRVAIVDTITEHCQKDAPVSWRELDFDFGGAHFHGDAVFGGAHVKEAIDLRGARIADGASPTFTRADGTTTKELPVIEAN